MTPIEMSRILNNPAALPHKEAAIDLVAPLYGQMPSDAWFRDPRVEAVALLLYTGALARPGTVSGKPDPQVAALQARIDAARRALG